MTTTTKYFCHDNDFEGKISGITKWKTKAPKIEKFLRAYQNGDITKEISSNGNLIKILYDLKIVVENLKGISPGDFEIFKNDLLADKILSFNKHKKKYNGPPYKLKRKKSLLHVASEYGQFANKKQSEKIRAALDVKIKIKNSDSENLTEEEYEKLRDNAGPTELKTKIEILYWLGPRAEEMHNVRISDVELPTGKKQFVRVRFRDEYSKTAGRTLEMFGKKSLEIMKAQLAKRKIENAGPEDLLFKTTYRATQKQIYNLSRKILIRGIHAHLFRHAAATRLASQLNRQQLCIWFGWRFSSPMPDRYIKRNGVDMNDIVEKFEKANVEELEKNIFELKEHNAAFAEKWQQILEQLIKQKIVKI